jgi:hypothetical protein
VCICFAGDWCRERARHQRLLLGTHCIMGWESSAGVFGELLAASFEFNLRPTVSGRPARRTDPIVPRVMHAALVTCPFGSTILNACALVCLFLKTKIPLKENHGELVRSNDAVRCRAFNWNLILGSLKDNLCRSLSADCANLMTNEKTQVPRNTQQFACKVP